ncbi:hypothetical protein OHS18_39330 [Amycolatopsis sp. NBC_00355]|uniref:hypothetical protein n=1 Tax=Amycolatopsis sp. NBC_00355 TaxID=2975957 RepID=UPI002E25C4D7
MLGAPAAEAATPVKITLLTGDQVLVSGPDVRVLAARREHGAADRAPGVRGAVTS